MKVSCNSKRAYFDNSLAGCDTAISPCLAETEAMVCVSCPMSAYSGLNKLRQRSYVWGPKHPCSLCTPRHDEAHLPDTLHVHTVHIPQRCTQLQITALCHAAQPKLTLTSRRKPVPAGHWYRLSGHHGLPRWQATVPSVQSIGVCVR